ncbi:unnamed protein product [Lupinus luteus]|uniref:Uncharacterized protein n=1 Tax=Lupinus luteus TaxID=3873 RepID=A0AAV1Y435_LUPLU
MVDRGEVRKYLWDTTQNVVSLRCCPTMVLLLLGNVSEKGIPSSSKVRGYSYGDSDRASNLKLRPKRVTLTLADGAEENLFYGRDEVAHLKVKLDEVSN